MSEPVLYPLGGDIHAQYTADTFEGLAPAQEACRVEQEAMCGYELVVKMTKQTHYTVPNEDGTQREVFEVFVTFGPKPPPPAAPTMVDGTQVAP